MSPGLKVQDLHLQLQLALKQQQMLSESPCFVEKTVEVWEDSPSALSSTLLTQPKHAAEHLRVSDPTACGSCQSKSCWYTILLVVSHLIMKQPSIIVVSLSSCRSRSKGENYIKRNTVTFLSCCVQAPLSTRHSEKPFHHKTNNLLWTWQFPRVHLLGSLLMLHHKIHVNTSSHSANFKLRFLHNSYDTIAVFRKAMWLRDVEHKSRVCRQQGTDTEDMWGDWVTLRLRGR